MMMASQQLVFSQAAGSGNGHILVYILCMAAGLLGGGAWSIYKNGAPLLALFVGICAVIAGISAMLWMLGILT